VSRPGLLFLHALPLDGSMWAEQRQLLPDESFAPTLYAMGETVEAWASAALKLVSANRLIVVGCSVGGSCAIEMARAAPERIAALVLIGTKAAHRPEPDLQAAALQTLEERGMKAAWRKYWAPLFSPSVDRRTIAEAERIALAQSPKAVARGISAFHTRPSRADFLSTWSRRIVFVSGAEDRAPGPKTAAEAAAAPLGSHHVIARCGHYVPLEKPQELDRILRNVIAEEQ
jgi:pimeloyl-ACP methyl ester carboxylesterase